MSWKHKIISKVAKILGIKVYFENPIHHSNPTSHFVIVTEKYNLVKHKIDENVKNYIEYYPQYRKQTVIRLICQELTRALNQLTDYDFDERMKVDNDYYPQEQKQDRYKFEFYTKQKYHE